MDKKQVRELVLDIGYLVNKYTGVGKIDISGIMDELNTMESYKPFQKVLKDAKELESTKKQVGYLEAKVYELDEEIDNLNDRLKENSD